MTQAVSYRVYFDHLVIELPFKCGPACSKTLIDVLPGFTKCINQIYLTLQFIFYFPILSYSITSREACSHLILDCCSERRLRPEVALEPLAKAVLLPGDVVPVAEIVADVAAEVPVAALRPVAHALLVRVVAEADGAAVQPLAEVPDVAVAAAAEVVVDVVAEVVYEVGVVVGVRAAHPLLRGSRSGKEIGLEMLARRPREIRERTFRGKTHLVEEVVPAATAPATVVVVVVVVVVALTPVLFPAGVVRVLAAVGAAAAVLERPAARAARPVVAVVSDLLAVLLAAAAVEVAVASRLLGVAVLLALRLAAAQGDLLLHELRLVLRKEGGMGNVAGGEYTAWAKGSALAATTMEDASFMVWVRWRGESVANEEEPEIMRREDSVETNGGRSNLTQSTKDTMTQARTKSLCRDFVDVLRASNWVLTCEWGGWAPRILSRGLYPSHPS
ncbi:hypothetical protein THAOC_19571 [Thalassiosira oceanica]|uniref:Uncharacterized protein n=1 Tax=Thalassiosira oceanica TaxID=159749 RepID=K0S5I5_THAOC|nr:hypothetical protein THAOC_19571 [Thalassiosira oceanica]|eukprot:EJK60134.1 hypothetical protein THAOC_19571 [Thalassiosira oceanica]